MTSVSTDTTVSPQPVRTHRRRWAWITIATVGLLSASAFVAVPAIADSSGATPTHATPGNGRVIVCESGTDTKGDIQMSAATATRVADGDTTPAPEGCREG
jgi:hypothetical protein